MQKTHSSFRSDFLLLLGCFLLGGLYSWLNGQDANWDLLNYHLYNAFAFLHGRFTTDIMPAGIHTFLNPLLDIPLYLFIHYFNAHPQLISFVQGFWGGGVGFVLYKICRLVFQEEKTALSSILALAIGITGSAFLTQVGLSYNEVQMAFFLCTSLYLLLLFIVEKPDHPRWAFLAAFIAGAAGGFKYTAAPFILGLPAAFFINVRRYKKPGKSILLFALGGLCGFLLTNGYFMWQLYHAFGNPLFPFFNSVFQSPYFDPVNFEEIRFYPKSTLQWLFYPFFWVFPNHWVVSEAIIADPRLASAQLAVFALLPTLFFNRTSTRTKMLIKTLLVFSVISFIVWMNVYGILRYLVTLELLSGILVILALRQFLSLRNTTIVALCLLVFVGHITLYPNLGRERFFPHAIELNPSPQIEENSLVLLIGSPLSFIAPFLPKSTRFIGGIKLPVSKYPREYWSKATQRYPMTKLYYAYHFEQPVKQALDRHTGPIYLLTSPWEAMMDPVFLEPLGLKEGKEPCQKFDSNINLYVRDFVLCPLEKISAPEAL